MKWLYERENHVINKFYEFHIVGMTFKEEWNTDNILKTEIAIEDQLVNGLKLEFHTSFAPQTGYVYT